MKTANQTQGDKTKKELYSEIKAILSVIPELELHKKKGSSFKFLVYLSQEMEEASVSELDLSRRSLNALRRGGIHTLGDLCDHLDAGSSLKNIRNCGDTSVAEIMDHLFSYNYAHLKGKKKVDYLVDLIARNTMK